MSVGYATLYGDMAGGFSVLKDISKMRVFALARYRNSISEVIPQNVIDRPPSAELAPDQKDEDSLPPYEVLDQILEMYIEEDMSAQAIIDAGFDADVVYQVVRMVDINEYKRRQSAIGPRVTPRGFGKDRRYPITNLWEIGD
jgi:NAD+ synthase (glutamine-hydrolysing)